MSPADRPENETHRLLSLRSLQVLDTESHGEFDAFVRAAASVCGTPIALITLVDDDRQWFKANFGLTGVTETPRDSAFCAHTILQDELLTVTDTLQDPRFIDNPLVTGDPNIRFYAGAPLTLRNGMKVGSLCVIDRIPRQINESQEKVLEFLADGVVQLLESRQKALQTREVSERMTAVGGEVTPGSTDQFAVLIHSERLRYEKVVRDAGIKPD